MADEISASTKPNLGLVGEESRPIRAWLKLWELGPGMFHVAVYSGSRLLLSFVSLFLTPLVLRRYGPSDAEEILFALGIAAFLGNVLSAWLEQVLYRFPLSSVGVPVRRVLGLQCVGVIVILVSAVLLLNPGLIGTRVGLLPLVAVLGLLDAVYRAGIVPVQMEGRDRTFILLNFFRVGLEISLGAVALYLALSPTILFLSLAVGRATSLWPLIRVSGFFHSIKRSETKVAWWTYGISLFVWFVLLQLIQLGPQFFTVRSLEASGSTAFLAAFRLYSSAGLLLPGAWLLYLHPKLLWCWREEGAEAFNAKWVAAFAPYMAVTAIMTLGVVLSYPLTSRSLLERYAESGWIAMLTIPGVFCWSISNLIQKFHEVTNQTIRMATHLAIGAAIFGAVCWVLIGSPIIHSAAPAMDISASFSIGFAVYLLLLSRDVLRMTEVASRAALRRVRLVFVLSLMIVVGLVAGLVAFHLSKLQ